MNGITTTIKVTDRHINGTNVSVQQAHVRLYVDGDLEAIELKDYDDNLLKVYRGPDLAKLIGSAISRGRRRAENGDFYYLGDR